MRKAFLVVSTRYQAQKTAPWAAVIAKAEGGFWAFESYADYRTWRGQR
jgi:hypothetical protein